MAFAAAIPLIASLIPAIGSLFGGGGGDKGGGQGGDQNLAATHAALGTVLANQGGGGKEPIIDHPVTKGTDLPPILAAAMHGTRSGHVLPHAATASGKMGHTGVLAPHLEAALNTVHAKQQQAPVLRHQEKAARAAVKRVQTSVAPELQAVKEQLRERATQIKATAEHRAIVERDRRWQQLAQKQDQILQKLDRMEQNSRRRWAA